MCRPRLAVTPRVPALHCVHSPHNSTTPPAHPHCAHTLTTAVSHSQVGTIASPVAPVFGHSKLRVMTLVMPSQGRCRVILRDVSMLGVCSTHTHVAFVESSNRCRVPQSSVRSHAFSCSKHGSTLWGGSSSVSLVHRVFGDDRDGLPCLSACCLGCARVLHVYCSPCENAATCLSQCVSARSRTCADRSSEWRVAEVLSW